MRIVRRLFLYTLCIAITMLSASRCAAGEIVFSDDFESGTIDLAKWDLDVDTGCSVTIETGQLKAYFQGNNMAILDAYAISKSIPLPENWIRVRIRGTWKITAKSTGEFTVRVFDAENPSAYVQGSYATWTTYAWDHFRVIDSNGTNNKFARTFPATYKSFEIWITPDGWKIIEEGETLGNITGNPLAAANEIQFKIGGSDYSSAGVETIYFDDVSVSIDVQGNYAWGENVGWINFSPERTEPDVGLYVDDKTLSGFLWAENIGWINLAPKGDHPDIGVKNDQTGLLTGYAWAENTGWINFNPLVPGDPNHYGVTIDQQGLFQGWAWGENIGWIHLRSETHVPYGVSTSWTTSLIVDEDDLAELADQWLQPGTPNADLNGDNIVDLLDFSILASYWLNQTPPGWPLGH